MVDPEVPVGPDVSIGGIDADADGRRDTVVVAGLATPTVVVDLDRDGRGDVMIEVSAAGVTRTTMLTDVGGGWRTGTERSVAPEPELPHWWEPMPHSDPVEHDLGADADPPDLLDCLLNLFS